MDSSRSERRKRERPSHSMIRLSAALQQPTDFQQQLIKIDGFGVEIVASRGEGLFARSRRGLCGQCDNRYVAGCQVGFEPARCFQAIHQAADSTMSGGVS
jgi:hypothetical protein